jgi:hypothetical protein
MWTWNQLFVTGFVKFRRGRLQAHYRQLRVGDLVVGYEASPRRCLAAIAKIAEVNPLDDEAAFAVAPVAQLTIRPDWTQLRADPVLRQSQPIRCMNQGILFTLTDAESQRILELIGGDPAVGSLTD